MAKDEETPSDDQAQPAGRSGLLVRLGMLVAVVGVGAGGGYAVNRLLRGSPAPPEGPQIETPDEPGAKELVYIDFAPVTVTLNTPQKDRFIRATITLAVRKKHEKDVNERVEKKKPLLHDKLITYASGLTLDDVGDAKNLNKIRREILEAFNDILWPDGEPLIHHLLFKEFAVM